MMDSLYLAWFGFILDFISCGIFRKLLLNFFLEKRFVLIEMLLVLFKIVAQIHFIYHVQAKTIGFNSAENNNSSSSPESETERNLKYPEFRIALNFEGSAIINAYTCSETFPNMLVETR